MIEILEEIYDVNGCTHQAVKNLHMYTSEGKGYTQPRRCAAKGCGRKTRVKCLQCGVPFCFALRKQENLLSEPKTCFTTHVHHIERRYGKKNTGFVDIESVPKRI